MTKERLSQLAWLKLEIEELTNRIRRIESALSGRASRINGMSWLGGTKDFMGDLAPQLCDLKDQLARIRNTAMAECTELQSFIGEIDDSQVRLIFTLRYIDSLSWHQVAWRLGGNTSDSVRMTHNRYLARLEP
ncbi:MAG: DUF1492 domain-containing protein [Oscillospiraceae bacterium]|nr:DUF1492 domain-containing protein [Oscillospiraceae bacterium]